jgi:hypothetical protein
MRYSYEPSYQPRVCLKSTRNPSCLPYLLLTFIVDGGGGGDDEDYDDDDDDDDDATAAAAGVLTAIVTGVTTVIHIAYAYNFRVTISSVSARANCAILSQKCSQNTFCLNACLRYVD